MLCVIVTCYVGCVVAVLLSYVCVAVLLLLCLLCLRNVVLCSSLRVVVSFVVGYAVLFLFVLLC